ncbi:MAG: hypothetical protein ACK5LN_03620 [Propioniciclava sp.]
MLLAVGVTYRQTSAEVIANLGQQGDAIITNLMQLPSPIHGLAQLATCNRFELYLDTEDFPAAVATALAALAEATPAHHADVADGFTVWAGPDAVSHLFDVAAGWDSMVVGETEITGQVRTAFRDGQQTLTPALTRVGDAALAHARLSGRATGRGIAAPSLAGAGLDVALAQSGQVDTPATLVVGTGRFAHVVVTELVRRGITAISVFSRGDRAYRFARTNPVTPVDTEGLPDALTQTDVVIACGGYREAVVTPATLQRRSERPLTLLDLTGGTDLDPGVARLAGVRVITLDDLGRRTPTPASSPATDPGRTSAAVAAFLAEEQGRTAAATVTALRDHVSRLVAAELASLQREEHIAAEVTRALHRVTNALLHEPTIRATAAARAGDLAAYQQALQTVFGIEVES